MVVETMEHFTMTLRERRVRVRASLTRGSGAMDVTVDLADETGDPLDWTLTRAELAAVCRAAGGAAAERLNRPAQAKSS